MDFFKRMSTEAHVYMRRHEGAKVEHFDISNVIYHKFSHGAASYTLNGENVNVMLEYGLVHYTNYILGEIGLKLASVYIKLRTPPDFKSN